MLLTIVLLPFLGFIISSFFGRWFGRGVVYITVLTVMYSFCCAFILLQKFLTNATVHNLKLFSWISVDTLDLSWGFYFDSLTISMVCIVTFISLLVHVYSSDYMSHDPHLPRFMAYLSLFTFFMLMLVTSDNFIQMFLGWEGVGLASYLLINFWYTRIQANKSAIKAMLFNRVADFCMILALCTLYALFDTFDYVIIFSTADFFVNTIIYIAGFYLNIIDVICILLFLGAMGKSAQLGLHNWLPDAMEGPTPVSALIHAATMVTAGIFLVLRCSFLFELSGNALQFIAIIGSITTLFGSSVGLFAHDLKRVIAFSTCSQLGYMMLACGLSAYHAAFFHLISHAFFKALLFLGAGAIIHAAFDEQDTRKFGGFIRYLPITYSCFLIGSLNLMGAPFLSGFYSKDMILEIAATTYTTAGFFCFIFGVLSVFFTAAYSTRVLLLVFINQTNSNRFFSQNITEGNLALQAPVVILALISIFFGGLTYEFFYGLGSTFYADSLFFNNIIFNNGDAEFIDDFYKILPICSAFLGFAFSIYSYYINKTFFFQLKINQYFRHVYAFLLKKWYYDRLINQVLVIPALNFSKNYAYISLDRGLIELIGPVAISESISLFLFKYFNKQQTVYTLDKF